MSTLRSKRDFARIEASGRARAERLMVVRFVPNALGFDRYAISTSRRVGGAVTRNRIRRRIREVLRASMQTGPGWDILIIVRPSGAEATFDEIRASLQRLLALMRESARAGSTRTA